MDRDSLLNRIEALVQAGEVKEARSLLPEEATVMISDPDYHIRLGMLARRLGAIDTAISELQLALRDDPGNMEALFNLASTWAWQKNSGHETRLVFPVNMVQKFARCLEERARSLEQGSRVSEELYQKAALAWKDLHENRPDDSFYDSKYISCTKKSGADPGYVIELATEAAERHPKSDFIRNQLAWAFWRRMKQAMDAKDFEAGAGDAGEALESALLTAGPAKLCSALARSLSKAFKSLEQDNEETQKRAADALSSFMQRYGVRLFHILEHEDSDYHATSALEIFLYLARKVCTKARAWTALEEIMSLATRRFHNNQWFACSHVQCVFNLNKKEEAANLASMYLERMPGAPAISSIYADVLKADSKLDMSIRIMERACALDKSPWSWQKLALLFEEAGDLEKAQDALACGLCFQKVNDAGKVWKLHHQRSGMLLKLHRNREACIEAWLAKEARLNNGWGLNQEQKEFLQDNTGLFERTFQELDLRPKGVVRKKALKHYKKILHEHMEKATVQARVKWFDPDRGFGFVALESGKEAFVHKSVVRPGIDLREGSLVLVRVVDSFDRKKKRKSLKVEWLQKIEPGQ